MKTKSFFFTAILAFFCSCEKIYPELRKDSNSCYDASLIDKDKPIPAILEPVCGCDGNTYENEYEARQQHGISSFTPGACKEY